MQHRELERELAGAGLADDHLRVVLAKTFKSVQQGAALAKC
jgi:hypothetical protein